jgi:hypothetical protein
MDSSQVSRKQLDALTLHRAPMLNHLHRLDARLQQCHFPSSDPISIGTRETIEKLQ